jgi:valyl-tRNA synthetase
MSKSKGNVVTPADLLDQYGSDAVRYWSASGRYGVDTAFDLGQIKVGRRLAVKILNASKFVLSLGGDGAGGAWDGADASAEGGAGGGAGSGAPVTAAVDRSMLAALGGVVRSATVALAEYDHTGALEATERFFWMFCDDYLELVKSRAYGSGAGASSARGALRTALSVLLRLFAPFLPFVTEEAWSWWQEGSVHRASWPSAPALASGSASSSASGPGSAQVPAGPGGVGDPSVLATAAAVLGQIRKAKSAAKVSMRAEVARVVVRGPSDAADAVGVSEDDLRAAGNIADLAFVLVPGGELATEVTLADPVTS